MHSQRRILAARLGAGLFIAWLWIGCGGDGPIGPKPDPEMAKILVDSANDSLGSAMNRMAEELDEHADSSLRPRDYDFTGINALYAQALEKDPSNLDAKFGTAFSGLLVFSTNNTLNSLIDRIKHVYDTLSFNPFPALSLVPRPLGGDHLAPAGIPMHARGFTGVLPALIRLDEGIILIASTDPMVSEIQTLLEIDLLPKIMVARTRLTEVLQTPGYTFTLTPEMQGNEGASPIEFDAADFHVFLAGLHAGEAALRVFFARNLDLPEYSVTAAQGAMNQNSAFLSLKANNVGKTHMSTAKLRILSAASELEAAIDLLLSEIGTDQSNDLIKVTEDDRQDLNDIKDSLVSYRSYFDGPKELKIVWADYRDCHSEGWDWVCTRVEDSVIAMVDVSKFFDNPMDNPKQFLPAYTVTLEAQNDRHKAFTSAHFSRQRYWAAMDTIFGLEYPNDTPRFPAHLPDGNTEEFYRLLGEWDQASGNRQFVFGWDDVYFYGWGCDRTDVHCYYSSNMWEYTDLWDHPDQVRTCFAWQANSFESWTWPFPEFNGLLPGMTSPGLKSRFVTAGFEWSKSNCEEF